MEGGGGEAGFLLNFVLTFSLLSFTVSSQVSTFERSSRGRPGPMVSLAGLGPVAQRQAGIHVENGKQGDKSWTHVP